MELRHLRVILKFPKKDQKIQSDEDDEFEDWGEEDIKNDEKYWFTKDKIDKISAVHNYLDNLPEVGKGFYRFSSIIDVATLLNNNKPLGTLEMGVLYILKYLRA